MDKELARHVVRTGFEAMRHLSALLDILKEHCSSSEYQTYLKGVASAGAEINSALIKPALAPYPDLEQEVDDKMKKYGLMI